MRRSFIHLFFILMLPAALVPFQNCSKGFSSNSFGTNSKNGVSSTYNSFPPPLEARINQVSYMSCPQAGATDVALDPMEHPYYRLRYGAYDNSNLIDSNNFPSLGFPS